MAVATERLPDVILLDLRLPDMDGAELARALRSDARTARIPVVVVSALRRGAAGDLAAEFAGYLEKPIDVGLFAEQVRSYCEV